MRGSLVFAGVTSREIRLARRPRGEPVPQDFELAEVELPEPAEGRLVVRNVFMSVDPYMRGRMNDAPSYAPPYELGKVMYGGAVGEVVAGGEAGRARGPPARLARARASSTRTASGARRCPTACRPSALLGALGMPGLTA